MYPEILPPETLADPKVSKAEIKVYNKMKEVLDDQFTVFYSRPWLGYTRDGAEKDGECDFVVAHPDYGYVAIEVKGGGITRDPYTNQWGSIGEDGYHDIKNPVKQALDSKHEILRKCKIHEKFRNRWMGNSHGIIFPDSKKPKSDLGPEIPSQIVCCVDEFENNFYSWILNRLKESNRRYPSKNLGNDGIQILVDILAPPINLHYCLGSKIKVDDAYIQSLTPSQSGILLNISDQKRAAISGSAGTGKTILAMEEAKRSIEKGERVLLTCYNSALSQFIQREMGNDPLLTIETYPSFCELVAKEAEIEFDAPPSIDTNFYAKYPDYHSLGEDKQKELRDSWKNNDRFYVQCPEKIPKACKLLPDRQFDTVIVDEGQDFNSNMLNSLESILDPYGKGKIRIFYDNNQDVYNNACDEIAKLYGSPYNLPVNLRNTQKIYKITQKYYKGKETAAYGPLGEEIQLIETDSNKSIRIALKQYVENLLNNEGFSPSDIAIIVPRSKYQREFIIDGKIGRYECQKCNKSENYITIDSVRRFKGLEKPVIIVIVTDELLEKEEWIYVALSRARSLLVLIGEKGALDKISNDV